MPVHDRPNKYNEAELRYRAPITLTITLTISITGYPTTDPDYPITAMYGHAASPVAVLTESETVSQLSDFSVFCVLSLLFS